MFRWLFRKKSLAEKTLDAMESQRSKMTPAQLANAEATLQRITEEVRASRSASHDTRSTESQVGQKVRSS